jgi:hypothetical protein
MAWLFVPELEDLSLDSESSGPDFAPFVTLSGKVMRRPLSWRGWASRPWIRLLSGVRFPISTANRGAAKWIASLEASPASHFRQPESVEDSQMSGGLATICSGWSMKYEIQPGGSSSCWKTSQVSLFTDSQASSEDWRRLSRAGGVQNGCAYPRAVWVPLTDVNASSGFSWPTPTAAAQGGRHEHAKDRRGGKGGGQDLKSEAENWPTPTAQDSKHSGHGQSDQTRDLLAVEATRWPTPTASDNGEKVTPQTRKGSSLLAHADKWETGPQGLPTVTAGESGSPQEGQRPQSWPTPNAVMGHNSGRLDELGGSGNPFRGTEMGRQRLNPAFVEALMGLPPGWSLPTIGCGASETQLWLSRQRRRLASLLGV